jgi:hypothetical protein
MGNRKLKPFSSFVTEEIPPAVSSPPPTNTAGGGSIAGLPPDLPPVNPKSKLNILRRKKRSGINKK